jgi:putative transposase
MITFLLGFLTCLSALFRYRYNLSIEIIALRQQLGILKRSNPHPRLQIHDRVFRILIRRFWPDWSNVLVIVKPETVVAWHRAGFRLFWRIQSRANNKGRPKTDVELRRLIKRMASENPTLGSPRIHGELLKLSFD